MAFPQSFPVDEIRARGSIKDGDVARLALAIREEPAISREAAEALLALQAACPIQEASWAAFFIDTITEYTVFHAKPEGYLVAAKARWLAEHISYDGLIETTSELELLVSVLEAARWSPPSLAQLALRQIRRAVGTGTGPLRGATTSLPGTLTQHDLALARRILLAYSRNGLAAVTRAEAAALLEIDRVITPGSAPTEWPGFLTATVGNAVLASLGHAVPERREALESLGDDDAIARPFEDVVGRAIAAGSAHVWATCRVQSAEERALARLARQRLEIVTSETIEEIDEAWLAGELGRAPRFGESAIAILAYLRRETRALPPRLNELALRASIAA